ncbi:FmdB family zinc ribbon protein [Desulfogranum japonicum]|uniref:FmdB family zinc ribbon protein n=1 Tax=Desulfogranum japonicum TaxID=231447 RepID=UPI000A01CE0D
MPIYEYQCRDCSTLFEHLTTSSQDSETPKCPKCASRHVQKRISASAMRVGKKGTSLPVAGSPCSAPSGFS